ncbi:MAG: NADH:flavin oxidoreductase/NADH oxidase family protein [Sphingomicrobium sp.]
MSLIDLGSPLTLPCGAVLKNRLAKAALTEGLADPLNRATERHERIYRLWSEGGAGLVITGNVQVDRRCLERPGNVAIDGNDGIDALRRYAKAGTSGGNHLWMQINHPGRQTPEAINPHPLAPSAIQLQVAGGGFGQPVAATAEDIADLVARFAHVATVARETGFTGVQIHAAHGYLISQFLSPIANHRTDQWGGSLENRARFLLDVVAAVRAAVGADFPIAVKLNSADFQKGGFTDDDARQVTAWLGEAGIDLLELSGGTYEQLVMIGAGQSPETEAPIRESTRHREAYFLQTAASLRPAATMPFMVTGGFRSAEGMRQALASGATDLIGLGRPMCVEPDLPLRLLNGETAIGPTWENRLRMAPDALDPATDPVLAQQIETWGKQGWFCLQLLRLGNGLRPDLDLSVFQAFNDYMASEASATEALLGRT